MACEWTCSTCGETFDSKQISALQHSCPVAKAYSQFNKGYTEFLNSRAGEFAVYYARRVIHASSGSNLPLAKS